MAHSTAMHVHSTTERSESAVLPDATSRDAGPWIFVAAPVTFAITLAVVSLLSRLSF